MHLMLADMALGWGEISLRLACAIAAGVVFGWDRERLHKPAGLRTFVLVALGSVLLAIIASDLREVASTAPGDAALRIDPLRILQGLIGGIGFLGAGTIIQSGRKVEGLTSAAGLWLVAALGIAFGMGFYKIGVLAGGAGFVTLVLLNGVEARIKRLHGEPADGDPDGDA